MLAGACALALALALLLGCGASGGGSAHAGTVVNVTERDFHITAPTVLRAGDYAFRVHNAGSTDHEFIIAPLNGGSLALRRDGLTVDEEAVEAQEPGSLEPGSPGATRLLSVHLSPGRYVLFCNMEGHYMGGMHAEVVVQ